MKYAEIEKRKLTQRHNGGEREKEEIFFNNESRRRPSESNYDLIDISKSDRATSAKPIVVFNSNEQDTNDSIRRRKY